MPVSSFDEADLGQLYQALTLLDHPSAALTPWLSHLIDMRDAILWWLPMVMLQVNHCLIQLGVTPLHECSVDWIMIGFCKGLDTLLMLARVMTMWVLHTLNDNVHIALCFLHQEGLLNKQPSP